MPGAIFKFELVGSSIKVACKMGPSVAGCWQNAMLGFRLCGLKIEYVIFWLVQTAKTTFRSSSDHGLEKRNVPVNDKYALLERQRIERCVITGPFSTLLIRLNENDQTNYS